MRQIISKTNITQPFGLYESVALTYSAFISIITVAVLQLLCSSFLTYSKKKGSLDSSVGIPMGYGVDGRRSISGTGKRFFSILQRPDRLWGSRSLLSNRYQGFFPWAVKPTIHLHPVPRSRMMELYLHSHICLHGAVPN
jgi:hypothetical protein